MDNRQDGHGDSDGQGPTLFGSVADLAGPGRPPFDPEDRHESRTTVRFTREEIVEVYRGASCGGSRLAVWIRDAAIMRARGELG